jgi:Fic family protein
MSTTKYTKTTKYGSILRGVRVLRGGSDLLKQTCFTEARGETGERRRPGARRRRDRMRALFARHGKLTRQEFAALLGTSADTAGRDLKLLRAEGLVEKVEPTRSPRTHCFRLRS